MKGSDSCLICVKRLVAHSDPNNYTLIEDRNYPEGNTTLAQIIPAFFRGSAPSAHIAVVCGKCERWSNEQLTEVIRANHHDIHVDTFCLETSPTTTEKETIYCTLIATESLEEAWLLTAQTLEEVSKKLREVTDPNRTHIEQVTSHLKIMAYLCKQSQYALAFTEELAEKITAHLKALQQTNDLPPVIILIHLPSEAFDCFATAEYCFPKQLEYVVKVIDYGDALRELQDQLTDARLLNTKSQKEIAKLHKEIEELKEIIRQLRQYTDRAEAPDKCTPDYALEADPLAKVGILRKTGAKTSERANPPEEADQIIYVNTETDTMVKSSPSSPASIPHTDDYLHKNEYTNPRADDQKNSGGNPIVESDSKPSTKSEYFFHQNGDTTVAHIEREKDFLPERGDHNGQ